MTQTMACGVRKTKQQEADVQAAWYVAQSNHLARKDKTSEHLLYVLPKEAKAYTS